MADSIGNIYGNALFEVCCEENCLDEVYGELGSIRDILFSQGQEEYVELLASPLVTENEKIFHKKGRRWKRGLWAGYSLLRLIFFAL